MTEIEISAYAMCWLLAAIALASMVSSATGMAGGVLMFAAMNTVIPLRTLVPIHGAVQIFNNATRSWLLRPHIRWGMCLNFAVGAAIGAALCAYFIVRYIGEFYPLLILAGLILYSLFKPKKLPAIIIADKHFVWVGFVTGIMAILVGAIDPLLGVFFLRDDLSKEEIVANKSLMQMFAHATKIPAYLFLGFSFLDNIWLIAIFTVAAVIGSKIGLILLNRINTELFFIFMKAALLIAAVRILYQLFLTGA